MYPKAKRWTPDEVIDPVISMPFTKAGAWRFIADKLRQDEIDYEVKIEILVGEKAKRAYVLITELEPTKPLYIKIYLYNASIWGKSFHYCEK